MTITPIRFGGPARDRLSIASVPKSARVPARSSAQDAPGPAPIAALLASAIAPASSASASASSWRPCPAAM
jgi:hypothetical protein